jgi:hypothetical protein
MEKCSLCEAPPEPGGKLCKHHLLQKQARRVRIVEKAWGIAKGAAGVVALILVAIRRSKGGNGDSSKA